MSSKKLQKLTVVLLFAFLAIFLQIFSQNQNLPTNTSQSKVVLGQQVSDYRVVKVIDGDTIEVASGESRLKIRIIGINTPETVDPRREVECFGREASQKAKEILQNKEVKLESDPTQAEKDRYGRALRYVFLVDGTDFGLRMIKEGYAYEYTYDKPYKFQEQYIKAQKDAEILRVGLWADNACPNL